MASPRKPARGRAKRVRVRPDVGPSDAARWQANVGDRDLPKIDESTVARAVAQARASTAAAIHSSQAANTAAAAAARLKASNSRDDTDAAADAAVALAAAASVRADEDATRAALHVAAWLAYDRHRRGIDDSSLLKLRVPLDLYRATHDPGGGDCQVLVPRLPLLRRSLTRQGGSRKEARTPAEDAVSPKPSVTPPSAAAPNGMWDGDLGGVLDRMGAVDVSPAWEGFDDDDGHSVVSRAIEAAYRSWTTAKRDRSEASFAWADLQSTRAALYLALWLAEDRGRRGVGDPMLVKLRGVVDRYHTTHAPNAGGYSLPLERLRPLTGEAGRAARVAAVRVLGRLAKEARETVTIVCRGADEESNRRFARAQAHMLMVSASQASIVPAVVSMFDAPLYDKVMWALRDGVPLHQLVVEVLVAGGVPPLDAHNWARSTVDM